MLTRRRLIGYGLGAILLAVAALAVWLLFPGERQSAGEQKTFFTRDGGIGGGVRCDADGDGRIDAKDVAVLKLYWKGFPEPHLDCDIDGKVDSRNLAILMGKWEGPFAATGTLPFLPGAPWQGRSAFHLALPRPPYVSPAEVPRWRKGDRFLALLLLSTNSDGVAAGEAVLAYAMDALAVRSVRTEPSLWTVWTEVPRPPLGGRLTFAGGRPGGFAGTNGVIAVIEFEVMAEGPALIAITDASRLYRGDPAGTRLPVPAVTADAGRPVFDAATSSVPIIRWDHGMRVPSDGSLYAFDPSIPAPTVASASHPDQDRWSANRVLRATLSGSGGGFSYEWGERPAAEPGLRMQNADASFEAGADGVFGLHARTVLRGAGSSVARRFFHVDATPPEPFDPIAVLAPSKAGARWIVDLAATDRMSGIANYDIREGLFRTVQDGDIYALRRQTPGTHPIRITARDRAGNERHVTIFVKIAGKTAASPFWRDPGLWIFIVGICLFLILWLLRRRRIRRRDTMI